MSLRLHFTLLICLLASSYARLSNKKDATKSLTVEQRAQAQLRKSSAPPKLRGPPLPPPPLQAASEPDHATAMYGQPYHERALSAEFVFFVIPISAFAGGLVLAQFQNFRTMGMFMAFFGGQCGMNLFMKNVLSKVDITTGFQGIPAPFAVSAVQQFVGFFLLWLWKFSGGSFESKPLDTWHKRASVIALAVSSVMNIGFNNLALSLLDISVHLIIRSTTPLFTMIIETFLAWMGLEVARFGVADLLCVILGTACSVVVVLCQHGTTSESAHFHAGVVICSLATVAAAAEIILVKYIISGHVKLNPLQALYYVAPPAAAFYMIPMCFFSHQVPWHQGSMTDVEVITFILSKNSHILWVVAFSGVLALAYNIVLYTTTSVCNASDVSSVANFNKIALIGLSMALGMEAIPPQPQFSIMFAAAIGCLFCFHAISNRKTGGDEVKQ
eukprot:TRINITY_DN3055_c0_g3_i1.p1 TRINITY_DN3055_c0_g3~~TRINITY_DN3055_c0_g3_i1.p1  ORF type:complete len:443 (-),score=80.68 TRINITY_DN3055_c0_g3_i1:396-1724(-)